MRDGKEPKVENRRSVVLDFDGTVTESDLLDRAALEFGDPAVYDEVEHGLDGGRLPLREVITREFEPVTAPLEEVIAWPSTRRASDAASASSSAQPRPTAGTSTSSRAASRS